MDLSLSFTLSFYLEKRFYEMKVANAGLSPDGFSHFPPFYFSLPLFFSASPFLFDTHSRTFCSTHSTDYPKSSGTQ